MPKNQRNTWIKFVTEDWLNDRALKRCSLAAQGLWMDMLCLANSMEYEDPLYGHFVQHDGKDGVVNFLDAKALAYELRYSVDDVKAALEELKQHKIYSISDDGYAYSRRLVRDRDTYLAQSAAGSKGGLARKARRPSRHHEGTLEDDGKHHLKGTPELDSDSDRDSRLKTQIQTKTQDEEGQDKKTNLKELAFDRLAKVARIDLSKLRRNSAWVTFPGVYDGWIAAGCDPEKDIWPTVEKVILSFQASTPGKQLPNTPAYLNQTVLMARDTRLKAEANGAVKGRFEDHKIELGSRKMVPLVDSRIKLMLNAWQTGYWDSAMGRSPCDPKCDWPRALIEEFLAIRSEPIPEKDWFAPGRPQGWV